MTLELILISIALVWLAGLTWSLWRTRKVIADVREDHSLIVTDALRIPIRLTRIDENHRDLKMEVSIIIDELKCRVGALEKWRDNDVIKAHKRCYALRALLEEMEAES